MQHKGNRTRNQPHHGNQNGPPDAPSTLLQLVNVRCESSAPLLTRVCRASQMCALWFWQRSSPHHTQGLPPAELLSRLCRHVSLPSIREQPPYSRQAVSFSDGGLVGGTTVGGTSVVGAAVGDTVAGGTAVGGTVVGGTVNEKSNAGSGGGVTSPPWFTGKWIGKRTSGGGVISVEGSPAVIGARVGGGGSVGPVLGGKGKPSLHLAAW
mmetsp:Transcript_22160/g.62939  ORF Transcript_22160/g.62939 Transcript_22160/m.62939 type:complete len:209 (-) Transcript_22160:430-1056(-)